jgi:primary-amine oxidase
VRPVIYRASTAEIIVPYGDPRYPFNRKCAFDVMDYGLGVSANSLELGCDCLGVIKYMDGIIVDAQGADGRTGFRV